MCSCMDRCAGCFSDCRFLLNITGLTHLILRQPCLHMNRNQRLFYEEQEQKVCGVSEKENDPAGSFQFLFAEGEQP